MWKNTPAGARIRAAAVLRRIAAGALLAATLSGNFAAHDHSLLAADHEAGGRGEERVVTRHNPLSRASHWHAVLAFVHEHDCVACHNQRLAGIPIQPRHLEPVTSTKTAVVFPLARARAASLLPPSSRGPPALL